MSRPLVEVLELRVAPATFLLPGNALTIPSDQGAQGTGAAGSVLLQPGDQLILDTNGNGTADTGEPLLVKVIAGKALVFLTDRNTDIGWDADEITGIAVSDGAKLRVETDVAGSIATTLDAGDDFTATLQLAKISDLTVTGRVHGSIAAGAGLAKASIGAGIASMGLSVQSVLAGSAANDVQLNFGPTATTLTFAQPNGVAGGSIENLTLAAGTTKILASNGGLGVNGKAGAGGSIKNLQLTQTLDVAELDIRAGAGGNASGVKGKTAPGGSVLGGFIDMQGNIAGNFFLNAGHGGEGTADHVAGSAGGAMKMPSVKLGNVGDEADIRSGIGGDGFGKGAGAPGGAFSGLTFVGGIITNGIEFQAGGGGDTDSGQSAKGAAAGALSNVHATIAGSTGESVIIGGAGGEGDDAPGGKGGDFSNITFTATGPIGDLTIGGTSGGEGSVGGKGGSTKNVTVNLVSGGFILLRSGAGGTSSAGAGGKSGDLSGVTINASGAIDEIEVTSRDGGTGTKAGGASGKLSGITVEIGELGHGARIVSGKGGAASAGTGGRTGDVSGITFKIDGNFVGDGVGFSEVRIASGSFSTPSTGKASSAAGHVSKVHVEIGGTADRPIYVAGGIGSDGMGNAAGGAGGKVSGVTMKLATMNDLVSVAGGDGGDGAGTGVGGAAGSVSGVNIEFTAVSERVGLAGGTGGTGASSGAGGSLSGFTIKSPGFTGVPGLPGVSLSGGSSLDVTGGVGAAGGSVSKGTVTVTGDIGGVSVSGGNGADGGKKAGAGGGIDALTFNFGSSSGGFSADAGDGGAGGYGAMGTSGAGGSVKNLKVTSAGNVNSVRVVGGLAPTFRAMGNLGGPGAAGGSIVSPQVNIGGNVALDVSFVAGEGSEALTTGKGGAGGAITGLRLTVASMRDLIVTSGVGGLSIGAAKGAAAGSVKDFQVTGTVTEDVRIRAAFGGKGGSGGAGGALMGGTLNLGAIPFVFQLEGGDGGEGTAKTGGAGGGISKVTANLAPSDITGIVIAGDGGKGVTAGGKGANVSDLKILGLRGGTGFIQVIAAGDGGDGTKGGAGGSVMKTTVEGDIGDFAFTGTYEFSFNGLGEPVGVGALLAGSGGNDNASLNGSVSDVRADRIAAIYATRLLGLPPTGAVRAVKNIAADVLGIDCFAPAGFDYSNVGDPAFSYAEGDRPRDGFVFVQSLPAAGTFKKLDGTALTPLAVIVP